MYGTDMYYKILYNAVGCYTVERLAALLTVGLIDRTLLIICEQ